MAAVGIATAMTLTIDMMLITECDFGENIYLREILSHNNPLSMFIGGVFNCYLLSRLSMLLIYSNESSMKNSNSGTTLS